MPWGTPTSYGKIDTIIVDKISTLHRSNVPAPPSVCPYTRLLSERTSKVVRKLIRCYHDKDVLNVPSAETRDPSLLINGVQMQDSRYRLAEGPALNASAFGYLSTMSDSSVTGQGSAQSECAGTTGLLRILEDILKDVNGVLMHVLPKLCKGSVANNVVVSTDHFS